MAHVLFVAICFILDEILLVIFPNSYLMGNLLFFPNLAFCAMMLTVRHFDRIDACLFAFACGMVYDLLFARTFLLYAIVFTIVALLIKLWSKHMTDTMIESLILCVTTIFVKDLLVYCYMSLFQMTSLPLTLWAERYELLTLLANAVMVMALAFFIRIKDDYLEIKALRIRKGERVEWFRLKSKE